MIKISIVMPVYNVEPYIRKCLDSVINQTYSNLEIICIDDGSTDNSGKICDEYVEKDRRIRVFHKHNGGVSSARNIGLNNLTGDYVGFVDPDDWIEPDMYEILMNASLNSNADISASNYTKDTAESSVIMTNTEAIGSLPFNRDKLILYAFKRDYYRGFGAYLCTKLFKSELINGLLFDENISVGEDIIFFAQAAVKTRTAVYTDKPLYRYFQREVSLFHSGDINKRSGSPIAYSNIINLFEENKIDPDIVIWVKRFYVYHASLLAELAYKQRNFEKLIFFQNEIKRFLNEYIETNKEYPDRIYRIQQILKMSDLPVQEFV